MHILRPKNVYKNFTFVVEDTQHEDTQHLGCDQRKQPSNLYSAIENRDNEICEDGPTSACIP